jgi:hypothetical protein
MEIILDYIFSVTLELDLAQITPNSLKHTLFAL